MNPPQEPAMASKWQAAASCLQCVQCQGPLVYQLPSAFFCGACARSFPIEQDILRLNCDYRGNNAIAADYYNSPLWPKFRFWEWVAHLPRGGERQARNEVLRRL